MSLLGGAVESGIDEGVRRGIREAMPGLIDMIARTAMDVCLEQFGPELRRLQDENKALRDELELVMAGRKEGA